MLSNAKPLRRQSYRWLTLPFGRVTEKYFPKDKFADAVGKKTWLGKKDLGRVMGCGNLSFDAVGHLLGAL